MSTETNGTAILTLKRDAEVIEVRATELPDGIQLLAYRDGRRWAVGRGSNSYAGGHAASWSSDLAGHPYTQTVAREATERGFSA